MANLHVAFASPNARFVEYVLAPNNVRSELLTEPVTLADGFIERPSAPGLGITLEPGFADRYPYRPASSNTPEHEGSGMRSGTDGRTIERADVRRQPHPEPTDRAVDRPVQRPRIRAGQAHGQ